jgi:NADH:ubiquinone oxidoreductase subunit 4 (subunit M)
MLLAILAVYFASMKLPAFAKTGTFDVTDWYAMAVPADLQFWCFLAFFLGFAIKVPDVPVPHLAARCARRGAHRGLGHPRRRPPEDGDLRVRPLLAAPVSAGTRRATPCVVTLAIIGIVYAAS